MNIFPSWVNTIRVPVGLGLLGLPVYLVLLVGYGAGPSTTDVGYEPVQPVAFSHKVHAGDLGMDCRYCHTTVEEHGFAAIPPTATCMNCHMNILPESPKLELVRESFRTGEPIPWRKVHDLPDFAYFNHGAHVKAGVSCVSCHGRVDTMEVVRQVETLSMGWCLECHRDPAPFIRPVEEVTNLDWKPNGDPAVIGQQLIAEKGIKPNDNCSTCHR